MSRNEANRRMRQKGRRSSWTFIAIPHEVQLSANWAQCSPTAIKLLLEIASRYNGSNNGDLAATISLFRPRGWTRSATIQSGVRELIHYGLLELTRQGGRHRANLYGLTWYPIHECGGKLDCGPTVKASRLWADPKPKFQRDKRLVKKI